MKKIGLINFLLAISISLSAQKITVQEYIETYKDLAIAEMKRSGVPASITLAQGILETESGNSDLVQRSNNHFGIKCKSNWTGESVSHTDDAPNECFRKYSTANESYRDHSDFLRKNGRYAGLFQLSPTDYKGWANGLKKAGYATNPKYPQMLIRNIEDNKLHQYDIISDTEDSNLASINETPITIQNDIAVEKQEPTEKLMVANENSKAEGQKLLNRLKVVHVPSGTSLLAVATQNKISLSKLLEFNELRQDGLTSEDQWLYLERKDKQGNRDFYITQQKESLRDIAQMNGVQLQYLMQYNQLKEDAVITSGTKILLKPSSLISINNDNIDKATIKKHIVKAKENCYSISKKYNVSVQQLKDWNGLVNEDLKIGQELIISK